MPGTGRRGGDHLPSPQPRGRECGRIWARIFASSYRRWRDMVRVKRAYEPATKADGHRVLVDRLWPRGLRKEDAHIDEWQKDVAPSDDLRRWFGHDPSRFREFRHRYKQEMEREDAEKALAALVELARAKTVTLVYGAHDEAHNNAVVLAQEIERKVRKGPTSARGKSGSARSNEAGTSPPVPRGSSFPRSRSAGTRAVRSGYGLRRD